MCLRSSSATRSEGKAQRKLNLTGRGRGAADASGRRGAAGGFPGKNGNPAAGGGSEIGAVREVEDFGAELQALGGVEKELPLEGKIHVENAGGDDGIAAEISEPSRRGRGEGAGIVVEFRPVERPSSGDGNWFDS